MESTSCIRRDRPAHYRIRVQGVLDPTWSDTVHGMVISTERADLAPPMTLLAGELIDQAALMGVLNLVYDLGLPLLSVEWVEG